MSSSPAPLPSSPIGTGKASKAPRKNLKDSTKEKVVKAPKVPKSGAGAPKPKVEAKRKQVKALTGTASSSTIGLPTPPLKTKLTKETIFEEHKSTFVPFIRHEAKEVPVHFIAALLNQDENEKLSFEVDDDTATYLTDLANRFSLDVDFKVPIRQGKKKNKGKFFVTGSIDEDTNGNDLVDADIIPTLLRELVEVKGKLKTYNFNTNDGGEVKNLKGCGLKIAYLAKPAQSPTGTSGDADDDGDADEDADAEDDA